MSTTVTVNSWVAGPDDEVDKLNTMVDAIQENQQRLDLLESQQAQQPNIRITVGICVSGAAGHMDIPVYDVPTLNAAS